MTTLLQQIQVTPGPLLTAMELLKTTCLETQLSSTRALTTLQDPQRRQIIRLGGLDAIVNAVKSITMNAELCSTALVAFNELSWRVPELQASVLNAAGAVVIDAMRRHFDHAELQRRACITLGSLTWGPHKANQDHIRAAGGLDAILETLRLHSDRADVHELARVVCIGTPCRQ